MQMHAYATLCNHVQALAIRTLASLTHSTANTCKHGQMHQQWTHANMKHNATATATNMNGTKQMPMTSTHATEPMAAQTPTHVTTSATDGHADVNAMLQAL